MKTAFSNLLKGKIITSAIAVIMIFSLGACSKKIVFPISTVIPSATAIINIKKDKNKNYSIVFIVKNMAGPERLQPEKKLYLVWMETEQNGTINLGQVNISKGLKGSLNATTPFKPTLFFVTAEDDATIKNPGDQVVLRTDNVNL
jgi:hypothetical protein